MRPPLAKAGAEIKMEEEWERSGKEGRETGWRRGGKGRRNREKKVMEMGKGEEGSWGEMKRKENRKNIRKKRSGRAEMWGRKRKNQELGRGEEYGGAATWQSLVSHLSLCQAF